VTVGGCGVTRATAGGAGRRTAHSARPHELTLRHNVVAELGLRLDSSHGQHKEQQQ
jgi:hypothetical protein